MTWKAVEEGEKGTEDGRKAAIIDSLLGLASIALNEDDVPTTKEYCEKVLKIDP